MTFEVVIKPAAERDITESAVWYEKKVPFCVHFTVEKEKIIVHAVLHTKKSPRIWLERQK